MKLKVEIQVELPLLPNFLKWEGGTIPIHQITDEGLQRIGEDWTAALIQKAHDDRKKP